MSATSKPKKSLFSSSHKSTTDIIQSCSVNLCLKVVLLTQKHNVSRNYLPLYRDYLNMAVSRTTHQDGNCYKTTTGRFAGASLKIK